MAKMMSPNTTIWWVDTTATFNMLAPTAAAMTTDLASGKIKNISAAIATGYTLNATASDTTSSKSIVDESNTESRGVANYEATLPFFREADPVTNTTSVYQIVYTLFAHKGVSGLLLKRLGYKYTVAPTAGQLISIFSVLSGNPRDTEEDAGGPIGFEVPFLTQGYVNVNEPLV